MPHDPNRRSTIKHILMSIFIGACVAFLTSLFDGLVQFLQNEGNNITGAAVGMARYLLYSRHIS